MQVQEIFPVSLFYKHLIDAHALKGQMVDYFQDLAR